MAWFGAALWPVIFFPSSSVHGASIARAWIFRLCSLSCEKYLAVHCARLVQKDRPSVCKRLTNTEGESYFALVCFVDVFFFTWNVLRDFIVWILRRPALVGVCVCVFEGQKLTSHQQRESSAHWRKVRHTCGGAHVLERFFGTSFSASHSCTINLSPAVSETSRKGDDSKLSDNNEGRKRGVFSLLVLNGWSIGSVSQISASWWVWAPGRGRFSVLHEIKGIVAPSV